MLHIDRAQSVRITSASRLPLKVDGHTHTYHRLVDLVAEDNAIEDTIYHLHRALNAGRIDLDRFLRVRLTYICHPERAGLLTVLDLCAMAKYRRRVCSPKSSS